MFRANTFFRNFEIQGPADRLLIYGILFVSECLGKIRPNMSARLVKCIPEMVEVGLAHLLHRQCVLIETEREH